jgi:hypothetical protein
VLIHLFGVKVKMAGYVTLAIAILGAITGIIGTIVSVLSLYRQIDRDLAKIRVGVMWEL